MKKWIVCDDENAQIDQLTEHNLLKDDNVYVEKDKTTYLLTVKKRVFYDDSIEYRCSFESKFKHLKD